MDHPKQPEAHIPPKERLEFKKLLAINPNYFGNLLDVSDFQPVSKMIGNTSYEEITCVGFNPALNLLEATIQIKRPGGYNGTLCTPGSTEYVRFYIDYGGGWIDAGLASFNAHDLPTAEDCAHQPDKPLSYVVTLALNPDRNVCTRPVLPKVRAILSWQLAPQANKPNWPPVWGNVLERHIQIKPRLWLIGDVVQYVPKETLKKLPPLAEANLSPIPLPDPPPLSIKELATLYRAEPKSKAAVEPHRFALAHVQSLITSGNQDTLLAAIPQLQSLNLDLAEILAALDKTKADVAYEEIDCLGLEYNLERLVATFRIKRPTGYSGGLCQAGSQEYVAFWADWDDTCQWTYLNTVAVNVHDITNIPADGLAYSAILPVDLSKIRRPCGGPNGGPKIARIRAVLSWNTPPSTTDPNALNYYGNRLDTHVQIRPGETQPGDEPIISIIGGIGIADIQVFGNGMTKPNATFAFGGSPADPWLLNRECPFGGLVIVQGPPMVGFKYRLWARKAGQPLTEVIVKNLIHVVNWLGVGSWVTPDPTTGYVTYMDTLTNMDQVLAHWTTSADDASEILLEVATLGGSIVGTTPWYTIQLDNTGPRRKPAAPPFEPPAVTCEIHIDSGGDCKDFSTQVNTITGHFVAQDANFGGFSLQTLPSSLNPPAPTTSTPSTSQTASYAAGGDEWTLDVSKMQPCGYVVQLVVYDRSIVGSQPGGHNGNSYDVGFCLKA